MNRESPTPQRPLWQQLGIWLIAILVTAGVIMSGNEILSSPDSGPDSSLVEQPEPAQELPPDPNPTEFVEPVPDVGAEVVPETAPDDETDSSEPSPDTVTAAEQLASLPIAPRSSRDGYRRDEFGAAWLDVDRNGCDTRNDILLRDLDDTVIDSRCRVLTGVLTEPFSGNTVFFERGEQTSALVQIDHVVALSNAWQTGAQNLTEQTRIAFANDPLNLIAVSGELNQRKGDSDAASWLPPQRGYWCEYVARQIAVKKHYSLWVTQAEHDQMARVLRACPNFPGLTPEEHGRYRPGDIPLP